MFPLLLEREPSIEEVEEEEAEEEEEEVELDEYTLSLNEEIRECFNLFDDKKSGSIKTKFLEKALKCMGIFLSTVEMEDVIELLDSDGFVEFEPFRNYVFEKTMEIDPLEALKAAFQVFDPDSEGLIPNDRLKRWLTTLGNPLTEKEAKELVKLGDPGNKGFVAYDNLVGLLSG